VVPTPGQADRPTLEASRLVAQWLAGPRSRLLRRAQVGRRACVLDLGCGHGIVTGELARRAAGVTVGLDRAPSAHFPSEAAGAYWVEGSADALPFHDAAFDLILCENALLWAADLAATLAEAARVLRPGGALIALEPDYGAMLEWPEQGLRELWLEGLTRAGADPLVGRKLPGGFEALGLEVWFELQGIPQLAQSDAVRLLLDLPLTEDERARVEESARALDSRRGTWGCLLHVPYVLVAATRRTSGAAP
jgi:SAM-dependent methyltransferase